MVFYETENKKKTFPMKVTRKASQGLQKIFYSTAYSGELAIR